LLCIVPPRRHSYCTHRSHATLLRFSSLAHNPPLWHVRATRPGGRDGEGPELPPNPSARLAIGAELDHQAHADFDDGGGGSPDDMFKPSVLGCSWCSRTFRYPSELRTHERVHTGEKPYSCSYCGQRFSASSNLRRHERRHVAQNGGQIGGQNSAAQMHGDGSGAGAGGVQSQGMYVLPS
jgi:DNA-directed RNA polymerase subunit RPC12/RpoP